MLEPKKKTRSSKGTTTVQAAKKARTKKTISKPSQVKKAAAAGRSSAAATATPPPPPPPGAKRKQAAATTTPKPDYYLIKSEPLSRFEKGKDMKFSIDDLIAEPKSTAEWDGVRNYQARNIMRTMRRGDKCLFYHSNAKPSGIVGVVEVVREAYPDPTQFDRSEPHYDPKSKRENPTWDMVDVKFVRKLKRLIPLEEIKEDKFLGNQMALVTTARLSVQPVRKEEWEYIFKQLEGKPQD